MIERTPQHLTKNGFQMEFMNQIMEQVKKPLDETVEYIFEVKHDGNADINFAYRWMDDDEPNYILIIGLLIGGLMLLGVISYWCYSKFKKRTPTFA